jgi:hypothetical protein
MKEGLAIPHRIKTATFAPIKNKTTPPGVIIWYVLQNRKQVKVKWWNMARKHLLQQSKPCNLASLF